MVSDQSQGATPYELFVSLEGIDAEIDELKTRLAALRKERADVGLELCTDCFSLNLIDECGIVNINGLHYAYELEPDPGEVTQFQLMTVVSEASHGSALVVQSST